MNARPMGVRTASTITASGMRKFSLVEARPDGAREERTGTLHRLIRPAMVRKCAEDARSRRPGCEVRRGAAVAEMDPGAATSKLIDVRRDYEYEAGHLPGARTSTSTT